MDVQNILLAAFPTDVRERLAESWRFKQLAHGEVLQRAGEEIREVYFPVDCLISITVTMQEAQTAEAGIVGCREMVGINAFMGGRETVNTEYVCQFPGSAIRVEADELLNVFDHNKTVRDILLKYTQAYIAQLSQNVACNRLHVLEQRLARWLLECRDRLQRDDFEISHEFISQMLGARRASVTETAAALKQRGLIDTGRLSIRLVDVAGLEKTSCECFSVIRRQYNSLLGFQ